MSVAAAQPCCEECGFREEEGMFAHSEQEWTSDREIVVGWTCPECGHHNEFRYSLDDVDDDRPQYTQINVFCPVCGCNRLEDPMENTPGEFESHLVTPICSECGTPLNIEYRAIDISWTDEDGGVHSAVSQGAIVPEYHQYPDEEQYDPLRRSVDYWYMAYNSDGGYEPVATEEDALEKMDDDDYEVHIARPTEMKP